MKKYILKLEKSNKGKMFSQLEKWNPIFSVYDISSKIGSPALLFYSDEEQDTIFNWLFNNKHSGKFSVEVTKEFKDYDT